MDVWQIQEAKARLSELVKCAQRDGPQDITLHGKSVAVVVSRELFDRLSGRDHSLAAFIQASPFAEADEDLVIPDRQKDPAREVDW